MEKYMGLRWVFTTRSSKWFARMLLRALLTLGATLVLFSTCVLGQTTGTILGRVSDSTGAAVSNARIEVENLETGLVRIAEADTEGSYLISSLPPGTYKLTATVAGFRTFIQTGITLQVAQNARVEVVLEIGEVVESLTVTGAPPAVDTQSSTVGATVDNLRVANLPLNGRNVLSLMQLLPGVGAANFNPVVTISRKGPVVNVSGGRSNDNNIMLDGTTMMTAMENAGLNLPSPDALQEFRVLTNTFNAEYGRSAGAVVLVVTKSGTNEVHGDLWEFVRNDALNARNFFASSKPFLRQNQFGASLGGPVVSPWYNGRNRTFLFGSYQGTRIRQQALITSFPPTEAERRGDFTAITQVLIDPLTNQPFPGNLIPVSRFDPLAVNITSEFLPRVNQPDGRNLTLRSQPTSGDQLTIKGDHKLRSSDSLAIRYYRNRDVGQNRLFGGVIGEALAGSQSSLAKDWTVAETHIFNPSLLNEFRASYTRVEGRWEASKANKTPRELGAKFNQDGFIPQAPTARVSGRFTFWPLVPLSENDDNFQFEDKISLLLGRHAIKAGGFAQRIRHLIRMHWQAAGDFTFSGLFTGNAMADYLIGQPSNLLHGSLIEDDARGGFYHLFVQDDFKLTRKFTLNLGLRYELNTPWVQRWDHAAAIRPGQQSRIFPTAPPGLVYPGDPGVPRGFVPTDKNNLLPRIGFAWDPFGKGRTSVRAAYGIFTAYQGAIISSVLNLAPPYEITLSTPSPPSFSDPYAGRRDPFPYVVDKSNPRFVYPLQAYTIAPNFRDAYTQQFNLNVQHQFGKEVYVQAGYFGTLGHKLYTVREINAARYAPGATAANVQARRPFHPEFYSSISSINSESNSNYHSLQVNVEKRFSRGYTFQVAYTLSKSIDERSLPVVDVGGVQDPDNYRKGERGLSDFNQRHILAINGIWELPFLQNKGLTSSFFGGWQLNTIVRVASGFPFTVVSGADFALAGTGRNTGPQRPDVVGDGRLDPDRPRADLVARYFNTAAFVRNAGPGRQGQYGNSSRNNLIGPGFAKTDVGISKRFTLPPEYGYVEFRGEIFNLFNQVNFGNPNSTLISPGFGRLLSAGDARIVQFALKYHF